MDRELLSKISKYYRYFLISLLIVIFVFPLNNTFASQLPIPNEEITSLEWGLYSIEAPKAWSLGVSGKGITVAVIDTGVDMNVGDLKENLIPGYNALTEGTSFAETIDNHGHGTQIASLIAGNGKGLGLMGVAPEAKILPVKVFGNSGGDDFVSVGKGVKWAADHGAQIINLSFGSSSMDVSLKEAVKYAQSKGSLIVAAVGNHSNEEDTNILFPASMPEVVAVGALTKDNSVASFSNTGNGLDFVAPGTKILSDSIGISGENELIFTYGTSLATPFVSGVAALLWSAHPELTSRQVISIIKLSAKRLDESVRSSISGYGLPNAYRAIKIADQQTLVSPAIIDYMGGTIKDISNEASLSISPLTWNSSGAINLQPIDAPAPFPSSIIPGSKAIQVSWSNSEMPKKILSLSIPVVKQSNLLNYLFRWDESRWIRIAGGVNERVLTVGIYEPGIYRIGQMPSPNNLQLSNSDSVASAIQVAEASYPTGSDAVILTNIEDFSNVLAVVPLAYKLSAPILLTYSGYLDPRVASEIQKLAPKSIYLIGGSEYISNEVEMYLSKSFTVNRLSGANRYATAALIAQNLGTTGNAVIVSGENFPDAFSIASIAATRGEPILLANSSNSLPVETINALNKLWVTDTLVVGGYGVISDTAMEKLPGPTRIGGEDRFLTNTMVNNVFFPSVRASDISASGDNFSVLLTSSFFSAVNNLRLTLLP